MNSLPSRRLPNTWTRNSVAGRPAQRGKDWTGVGSASSTTMRASWQRAFTHWPSPHSVRSCFANSRAVPISVLPLGVEPNYPSEARRRLVARARLRLPTLDVFEVLVGVLEAAVPSLRVTRAVPGVLADEVVLRGQHHVLLGRDLKELVPVGHRRRLRAAHLLAVAALLGVGEDPEVDSLAPLVRGDDVPGEPHHGVAERGVRLGKE